MLPNIALTRTRKSGLLVGAYNIDMQRKIFWTVFIALGLIADVLATIPIGIVSWWVAYRSDWF